MAAKSPRAGQRCNRPFRDRWGIERRCSKILNDKGTHFGKCRG